MEILLESEHLVWFLALANSGNGQFTARWSRQLSERHPEWACLCGISSALSLKMSVAAHVYEITFRSLLYTAKDGHVIK